MQEITDDMGLFITVSTVQLSVPRPAYAILVYSGSLFIIHGTSRKVAVNKSFILHVNDDIARQSHAARPPALLPLYLLSPSPTSVANLRTSSVVSETRPQKPSTQACTSRKYMVSKIGSAIKVHYRQGTSKFSRAHGEIRANFLLFLPIPLSLPRLVSDDRSGASVAPARHALEAPHETAGVSGARSLAWRGDLYATGSRRIQYLLQDRKRK